MSGVKLSTRGVEVLMFADDMVLMGESAEGLEKNLGLMSEAHSRSCEEKTGKVADKTAGNEQ